MGQYVIRREQLELPQSARDVFELLAKSEWIERSLAEALKRMIGFRNIAIHEYQSLQHEITVKIITDHLDDFLQYTAEILTKNSDQ